MPQIDLGKIRFAWKGEFNSATTYSLNDVISESGATYVYVNNTADAGNLVTDTAYWAKMIDALSDYATVNDLEVTGDLDVGALSSGLRTTDGYTNPIAVFSIDADDDYAQLAVKNTGDGVNSSTDIIAYANNGDDDTGWIDMGITSSNFSDPDFTITGANDGYIFMSAPDGTTGSGNLVLATDSTGTENKIIFAAGGLASDNTQMEITPDVNVHIEIPTPSTSPTSGALTVVGGVGIQGDMNVQGDVSIEGTITFGGSGTTVETANLSVSDPLIFVGSANPADIIDLGFVGQYATTVTPITASVTNKVLVSNVATLTTAAPHTYLVGDWVVVTDVDATFNGTYQITVASGTDFSFAKTAANVTSTAVSPTGSASVSARRKFSGVVRDASDGVLKAFKDATAKPATTVNFSEAGLAYADLKVAGFEASSITVGDVSNTEFGYLDGVTSAIQTQLDSKAGLVGAALVSPILTSAFETVTTSATAATGTVAVDIKTSAVKYFTSAATANWTFNFRGNGSTTLNSMLATGQSATVAFLVTNGSTAYRATAFQVDGAAVTPKWQGGTAPTTGNANSIDSYTFTLVKTGSAAFTVFASQTKFA